MWNVLAVDDSATSLALLERLIVRLGHRPLLADCSTRALAVCAAERPDVMLLDVVMPDIDGWELAARLRAQNHLRGVPIVFQSSVEAPEEIARCIACGAVDILPKPLRLARLAAVFEALGAPSAAGFEALATTGAFGTLSGSLGAAALQAASTCSSAASARRPANWA